MQYLLLIYSSEAQMAKMTKGDMDSLMGAFHNFTQSIIQSGNYKGGNPLQPSWKLSRASDVLPLALITAPGPTVFGAPTQ